MQVDDIDEDLPDLPLPDELGVLPFEPPAPASAALKREPQPDMELLPAVDAAELEEQVEELMLRDRKAAVNMVRAVLRKMTPAEFEEVDFKVLQAESKKRLDEQQKQEREAEKAAKRQAKIAEDEAKRLAKLAEQEAKKQQREEAAAEKKRQKLDPSAANMSDTFKQKVVEAAAKKGYRVGMRVEAPLLNQGGADAPLPNQGSGSYAGSWYSAVIVDFFRPPMGGTVSAAGVKAHVRFEPHEEMGEVSVVAAGGPDGESMREDSMRAEGMQEDSVRADSVRADDAPTSLSCWIALDSMRPAPPPRPADFASMAELGQALEVFLEGGWWEVELLGTSGLPVSASEDPQRTLMAGSRVRVQTSTSNAAYDGLCGRVQSMSVGWANVELDCEPLRQRGGSLDAQKFFRPKECVLLAAADAETRAAPMFTVRLLTAAAEAEGVYTVPLERIRPGWVWKPGTCKWVGRWADKQAKPKGGASPRPGAASPRAALAPEEARQEAEQLRLAWPMGKRVEVMQSDEGYEGSWYAGEVVGFEPGLVVVKYDELFEGSEEEEEEAPEAPEAQEAQAEEAAGAVAGAPSPYGAAGGVAVLSKQEKERRAVETGRLRGLATPHSRRARWHALASGGSPHSRGSTEPLGLRSASLALL